jgi:hypothetical protein
MAFSRTAILMKGDSCFIVQILSQSKAICSSCPKNGDHSSDKLPAVIERG